MSLSKSLKRKVDNQNRAYKANGKTILRSSYPVSLMESPCVSYETELSRFAKHKPMFCLFRSDTIILLQHFCRAEVQLKTSDEIKNANHDALVIALISAWHQLA